MRLEPIILNALTKNKDFSAKVRPHLNPLYFGDDSERLVYEIIDSFYQKYGNAPPRDSVVIELESLDGVREGTFAKSMTLVKEIYSDEYEYDTKWLIDQSEEFCKEKAMYNAIMKAVGIINGESKDETAGSIPDIMQKALAVAFDTSVGHDYFDSAEDRWDFYNKKEVRYKTRLDILNKITGQGIPTKSLTAILGASGSGKSAFKCALAADFIRDGHDVLYITLELAEERVAERIDANLLNIPIAEVKKLSKDRYSEKFDNLKTKGYGKLVIKEYATGAASVNHFNLLMDELKQKKNFQPKIVFVDYLQIVASSRYKASSSINTYAMQKYVAEELRAFAMVHDVPVITSVQTNRSGFNVSDLDESNIADSAGIIHVLDFLGALIRDEQLKEEGKAIFKQIKNRWGDPTYYNKFAIGFDTSRMAVYNLETTEPANKEKSAEKIPSQTNNSRKPSKVDDWEF